MANLEVRVVRRDGSAEVIWDWPPGIDEVYFTYAHDGFPPRPSPGNRVAGLTLKRNRNEKNHQLEISNLQSQQPLFVAIWPKGTSNEEGLFGTDCREIKLNWSINGNQLSVKSESAEARFLPTLSLVHVDGKNYKEIAKINANEYDLFDIQSVPRRGILLLELPHAGYLSFVSIHPPMIQLSQNVCNDDLFTLLTVLGKKQTGQQISEVRRIISRVDFNSFDLFKDLLGRSGQEKGYYAVVLEAFQVTVETLEELYETRTLTDAAARAALMNAVRDIHKSSPDTQNKKAKDLLWRMVNDDHFLPSDQRLNLLKYLLPTAQWDLLRSLLIDGRFPAELKQSIMEFVSDMLNTKQEWSEEKLILDELKSIAVDSNDFELRLRSIGVIAEWANKRNLAPYRTLEDENSPRQDDTQRERQRWAYRAAEQIAGLDSFFNNLPVHKLDKLTNLGRSGSPRLAEAVYQLLRDKPQADVIGVMKPLLLLFLNTRSSNPELLRWLIERARDTKLDVAVRSGCLDVLIATPTRDTNVLERLTGLVNALLKSDSPEELRKKALALIRHHHLGTAASDLVDILREKQGQSLYNEAVAAWLAAPNVETLEACLRQTLTVPVIDIPGFKEAEEWARALENYKLALKTRDEVAGKLAEICSKHELPWQSELGVITATTFDSLRRILSLRRDDLSLELCKQREERESLSRRLNNRESSQTSIKERIENLETQLDNIKNREKTLKMQQASIEEIRRRLLADVNNLQQMQYTPEAREELERHNEQLGTVQVDAQRCQSELGILATNRSNLEKMLEDSKKERDQINNELRELRTKIAGIDQEIRSLDGSILNIEKGLRDLESVMEKFVESQEGLADANRKVTEARRSWEQSKNEADRAASCWIDGKRETRIQRLRDLRAELAEQQNCIPRGRRRN